MTTQTHTPGPWYAKSINENSAFEQGLVIDENTGQNIAVSYDPANAAFIVTACNAHADLLAALELALATYDDITTENFRTGKDKPARDAIRAAIAKARGEA